MDVSGVTGYYVCLFEGGNVLCACAKSRDTFLLTQFPEAYGCWLEWTSIENKDRCAGRQSANEPRPHHPRTRCKLEKDVIVGEVAVQDVFFLELDKEWSAGMYDGLGETSCTRGIEDHEGMIERNMSEFELRL